MAATPGRAWHYMDYNLPADGTRGGNLLAWKRAKISLSNPLLGLYHVTTLVSPLDGAQHWWLSVVYGP